VSGASPGSVDLRLSCQPGKDGSSLVFPYSVTNQGTSDAYIMDALASVDTTSRSARSNTQWAVVLAGPGDDATIGRMLPPLPTDRRIAMPVIPLARRLARGETWESRIEIPEPLAETSPYYGDLQLRQYEIVHINGVVVSIGYWDTDSDGLAALPVEYAPGLFTVVTRNTVRSARSISQRFPAHGLRLFKRTDQFPRIMPGASAPAAVSRADVAAA
jgi:hypothetical protein